MTRIQSDTEAARIEHLVRSWTYNARLSDAWDTFAARVMHTRQAIR